jgi:hypothetical protein
MNNGLNHRLRKKILWILPVAGLAAILFFGIPDGVLYAKVWPAKWIPVGVLVAAAGFFVFRVLHLFGMDVYALNDGVNLGISAAFCVALVWAFNKPMDSWTYRAQFTVNGQTYRTYREKRGDSSINEGDSVAIVYSRRNPKNNKLNLIP